MRFMEEDMHKYVNYIFLGIAFNIITAQVSNLTASEGINAGELAKHFQNYYKGKLEISQKEDNETFEIRHHQAKKRKRDVKEGWPVISRETYFSWIEDTEKQIETVKSILDEGLKQIAPIFEIEEIEIENNKEDLMKNARVLLRENGFETQEKELITLTNFYGYLKKNKPEPLIPSIKLAEFLKYLSSETDYKITIENKKGVKEYLMEYYFPN